MLAIAVSALTLPSATLAASGGASADDGAAGGSPAGAPPARATAVRPVARTFRVSPSTVTAPRLPSARLRIDQSGARSVRARIVFWPRGGGAVVARADLGRVPTGRTLRVRWPRGMTLAPGRYLVRLHVRGRGHQTLARTVAASGRANLTVRAAKPAPAPVAPAPVAPAAIAAPAAPPAGPFAFPVAGPHALGGAGSRFGAAREGHLHEGQDIAAAEGTPVVAPVAGTVIATRHQPSGAGYYVAMDGADGRSYLFAHCQKDSFATPAGSPAAPGQRLCSVGRTGSATGPHLHFEIWLGGWRASAASHPIDPLPDLLAWGG